MQMYVGIGMLLEIDNVIEIYKAKRGTQLSSSFHIYRIK